MTEKQDEKRLKELLSVFNNKDKKELIEILNRDQIRYHKDQLREMLIDYSKYLCSEYFGRHLEPDSYDVDEYIKSLKQKG